MDLTLATRSMASWKAGGELALSQIIQRIHGEIDEYSALNEEERSALAATLKSCALDNNAAGMTESTLRALLQAKAAWPSPASSVVQLMFDMMAYLSTIPFPPPSTDMLPRSLCRDHVTRALVWLLPKRADSIIEASDVGRARTPADHRRLLFQSLASSRVENPTADYDVAAARARAMRNAYDIPRTSAASFAGLNHDSDGDEMYHDVLDVMFSTQPRISRSLAPVARDQLRPLAKEVVAGLDYDAPRLYDLAIPQERLVALLRLLLALKTAVGKESPEWPDLAIFDAAAARAVAPFISDAGTGIITYSSFDDALKTEPSLFTPLYRLLEQIFLDKKPPRRYNQPL